ncbi:hypothetical protein TVAG_396270 [Trichomonas vaginalis G3]|uniref:Uncharacterized protein n=1 Tax=Trichomonas vaginalis (strain ATCC PRA-98 / G3) TaxID=412133 RepID=A2ESD8_TRIV3|nr:hypothetical protein TVAGG3_0883150 [Trichomonas vaginalis G3]EAY04441.1 hypothetical protein TVAG_396270 [Trichomonas vaginalis G3]KAI5502197.1 hypothetical protein TVAGG3_0883150 [Trichomonas vaginalis G3]|eukprot:XP_001316664.1 hypothetical protein [Trichomonas vaginalis G3]
MCKEADNQDSAAKYANPNALPEPTEPTQVPQDALVPPQHSSNFDHQQPTIANAENFSDKDLSSVSSA